jgi:hypothetical protein
MNHVHFARGLSTYNGVITRMHNDSEVLIIYLDVQRDLQDAMKPFIYANKMVLIEVGFNGVIPPNYFTKK